MKKLIILSFASLMMIPVFAQFSAGELGIGGAIRLGTEGSKSKDGDNVQHDNSAPNTFNFSFIPRVQYFVKDNFSIGGRLGVDFYNSKTYDTGQSGDEVKLGNRDFGFGIGPIANYYWGVGEKKKAGFYAEGGVAWWLRTGTFDDYDIINDEITKVDKDKTNQIYLGVMPGVFYRPTDCIYFDFAFSGFDLGFWHSSTKSDGSDVKYKQNSFSLGGDLDFLQRLSKITIGATLMF